MKWFVLKYIKTLVVLLIDLLFAFCLVVPLIIAYVFDNILLILSFIIFYPLAYTIGYASIFGIPKSDKE